MKPQRTARRRPPKAPAAPAKGTAQGDTRAPVTLADVTIHFDNGPYRYTITGRQIATLLLAAVEQTPSGHIAAVPADGFWAARLQGLGALLFPDAGPPRHEGEARWLVSDLLEQAAAEINAETLLRAPGALERFTVVIAPGSGEPTLAKEPAAWRGERGGAA